MSRIFYLALRWAILVLQHPSDDLGGRTLHNIIRYRGFLILNEVLIVQNYIRGCENVILIQLNYSRVLGFLNWEKNDPI